MAKRKEEGPPCGPMVMGVAERLGMSWPDAVQHLLYNRFEVTVPVRGGQRIPVSHIPGHLLGSGVPEPTPIPKGPRKSDVFVLTSHPNAMEDRTGLYMSGSHGQEFRQACYAANVDPSAWFVTGVCHFMYPNNRTSPLAAWAKEERYLLERELDIVQPKYIMAMGAHAVKALLPNAKLTHVRGSVQNWRDAKVFPTYSPHNVTAQPETQAEFYRDIGGFAQLLNGTSPYLQYAVDIELLDTPDKIQEFVQRNMHHTVWAVDCEWGKDDQGVEKLRMIQLCAEPGKVGVVHLRSEGTKTKKGATPMKVVVPDEVAAPILVPLLCRPEVRVIGHFARGDIRAVGRIGIDIRKQFSQGMDTILAHHALYPTDEQQLELVANKLLSCGRYDLEAREWLDKHKKEVEIYSYGTMPDYIMIPYAAHDVDKTLRCAGVLMQQLNLPENEGLKDLVFGVTMPAGDGILEMETEGIRVDMERFAFLEERFNAKQQELLDKIRSDFAWEDFNPNSSQQKIDLLFGSPFHDKRDEAGNPVRIRPEHVECLDMMPVKTTGKKPKLWEDVVESNETKYFSPSTDDETLGILAVEDERISNLRDYAYVSKIISSFMKPPEKVGKQYIHVKGLRAWCDPDGYVRTHLSQLAETGRWKSFEPNMQNLPTQRETDFKRIFDDPAWPQIKSMFIGDEDMPVLVETDIKTAEVVALAWLANDQAALHILMDPKRDIHSEMAIKMFHLPYDDQCGVGTKKWTAGIAAPVSGKITKVIANPNGAGEVWIGDKRVDIWSGLKIVVNEGQVITDGHPLTESHKARRISAKTLIFGIPYGRGSRALAREISKFGVDCSRSDAQAYVDEYLTNFKDIAAFLQFCRDSVYDPGYLENVYGRKRFFHTVANQSSMKASEREACNWFEIARTSIKRGELRESHHRVDTEHHVRYDVAEQSVILSQARGVTCGKVQRLFLSAA